MSNETAEGALTPFRHSVERKSEADAVAHNFATREGASFVKLIKVCAIHEYVLHDSGGKKGTVLCLDSGYKIETTTPIAEVLTILKW